MMGLVLLGCLSLRHDGFSFCSDVQVYDMMGLVLLGCLRLRHDGFSFCSDVQVYDVMGLVFARMSMSMT